MTKTDFYITCLEKLGCILSEDGRSVTRNGSIRKVQKNSQGYLNFTIYIEKKHRMVALHRWQAFKKYGYQAFQGRKMHVRHLDNDKTNNSFDNLSLGTPSQNMMDIPKEKRQEKSRRGYENMSPESKKRVSDLARERSLKYNQIRPYKNKTGFRGVCKVKDKYICQFNRFGKQIVKYGFKTPQEAHEVWLELARTIGKD